MKRREDQREKMIQEEGDEKSNEEKLFAAMKIFKCIFLSLSTLTASCFVARSFFNSCEKKI